MIIEVFGSIKLGYFAYLGSHSIQVYQRKYISVSMRYSRSSVVFALLMMAMICSGHIGGHISYQDINPQVYCGRNLARALAAICFEEGTADKRSETGSMYGLILSPYYKEQEGPFGWPWIAPHKAKSFGLPSRGKRFVVNECCDKACSINELMSYC